MADKARESASDQGVRGETRELELSLTDPERAIREAAAAAEKLAQKYRQPEGR